MTDDAYIIKRYNLLKKLKDPKEIKQLLNNIYEDGFSDGHNEGYNDGLNNKEFGD